MLSNGSDHYEMTSSVVVPIEVEDIVISDQNRFDEGFRKDSEVFRDSYILGD